MIDIKEQQLEAIEQLKLLLQTPTMRPFLFRTRFERTMVRIRGVAQNLNNKQLIYETEEAILKMKGIIDKSNCSSDGVLRSYSILNPNMKKILESLLKLI